MNIEEFNKLSQKIKDDQADENDISLFLAELNSTLSEIKSILLSKKKK